MPKMTVFKGDKTWDSFIFQFERVADRCGWSSRKQAEKLVDCLGGKALEYVRELRLEEDFTRMKRKLAKRFGVKDAPITVRRQLQFLKQEENESLEEFSQRVHFLVMDGYPGALESTIEQIAVEHFLKGCIDHRAASVAMNKNPTHIHKAVKYTKDAINNRKVLYGKSATTSSIRKVSFNDDESLSEEEDQQEYKVRKTIRVRAATAEKQLPISNKFERSSDRDLRTSKPCSN